MGHEKKDQDVQLMRDAFKVKAQTVTLHDGVKTDLHIAPIQIYETQKGYRDDEFHVGVTFDVSEYQNSATEKLISAQLVVIEQSLVDEKDTAFITEKVLSDRGLPIYVFEQNDEEQLLMEEKPDVIKAIENSWLDQGGEQEKATDIMTEKSDLETELIEDRKALFKDVLKPTV